MPLSSSRRNRLIATLLGVVLVGSGLFLELPTGPQTGSVLHGKSNQSPQIEPRLRIGTFNIHGGRGRDGRFDLTRTTEAIQGLDLVGLNEVHRSVPWESSQAELLGQRLDLNWLFAPTEYCWRGEHFGSALLTRIPVDHWQRIPLEHRRANGYRNMLLVEIPLTQTRTLRVIITHLDRTLDREHQLNAVFRLFSGLQEPALLMGDLNTPTHDPLIRPYLDSGDWIDCVGQFLSPDPPNRIDWILGRGVKPVAGGRIDNGASDHPCVWTELDVSPLLNVEDNAR